MDLRMPGVGGVEATRQIRAEHPICAHGRGRGHVQLAEQRGECALS
jgi:CheY-like chemotaxis protein